MLSCLFLEETKPLIINTHLPTFVHPKQHTCLWSVLCVLGYTVELFQLSTKIITMFLGLEVSLLQLNTLCIKFTKHYPSIEILKLYVRYDLLWWLFTWALFLKTELSFRFIFQFSSNNLFERKNKKQIITAAFHEDTQ